MWTLWLVLSALAAEPVEGSAEADPFSGTSASRRFGIPTQDATFPTGFRVVLAPDDSLPVVGVTVVLEGGGAQNPPGQAGLAHLVEHLWFRSRQRDRPPTFEYLQSLGCTLNAFTSLDEVRYETGCPSHLLARLLQHQAQLLVDPLAGLDEQTFTTEREVVHAERRLGEHTGAPGVWDALLPLLHRPGHPYAAPNVGTAESLDGLTLQAARAFTAAHYVPSGTTLVITGDFTIDAALRMVFRAFPREAFAEGEQPPLMRRFPRPDLAEPDPSRDEDWVLWLEDPANPGQPLPRRTPIPRWEVPWEEPEAPDGTVRVVEASVEERLGALVWVLPPVDPYVTGVLPELLGRALTRQAFPKRSDEGECGALALRRETLMACFVVPPDDKPVDDLLARTLANLTPVDVPEQSDLSRRLGIVARRLDMLAELEPVAGVTTGRNAVLAEHVHLGHRADYLRARDRLLQDSTLADAGSWLQKNLDPAKAHRFELTPATLVTTRDAGRTQTSLPEGVVSLRDEATPERSRSFASALDAHRVADQRLVSGLRIVAVDHGRMPMVDILLAAPAPTVLPGTGEILSGSTWTSADIEGNVLLSQLGLVLGPDVWVVRARVMTSEVDKGLEGLRTLVETWKADPLQLARIFREARRVRQSLAKDLDVWPWWRALAETLEPAWRDEDLLFQSDAARADLMRLTPADLRKLFEATFTPGRSVLVVAGSADAEETSKAARAAFLTWKGREAWLASPPHAPVPPLPGRVLLFDEAEATQAEVTLVCIATEAGADARHAAAVVDLLRRDIYRTLRQELGWAYSPGASGQRQLDRARYELTATVPFDRVEDTVTHLRALATRVEQEGFDEGSLTDLRTRTVLQTPLRRQTSWSVARGLSRALLQGHSTDDWREVRPLVDELRPDDVRRAMGGCGTHQVLVVQAPQAAVPPAVRARLGGSWTVIAPGGAD